jgi:XTP/dITP diphosphohydrolase
MKYAFDSVVVATRNEGKLREFRSLLETAGWSIRSLRDLAIETDHEESGSSFEENARLKALAYSRKTTLPVLADDSGLEVSILGGRPGIHSARYAGPGASDADRIRKLLRELEGHPRARDARFVCALALARDGVILEEVRGECKGRIEFEPRGNQGFGYDPIFLFPELGKTYAELTETEKNLYSHRAHAVSRLLAILNASTITAWETPPEAE